MIRAENAAGIIKRIDISAIIGDSDFSYYILRQLNGLPFTETRVRFPDLEEFVKTDAVANEISGVIKDYSIALARGNLDYYLTTEKMVSIMQNIEPELHELLDHHMTEADKEHMARVIDDVIGFSAFTVGDVILDADNFGIDSKILYLFMTPYLLWGVGTICIAIFLIIFWINRSKFENIFLFGGIPIALSGLLFVTIAMALRYYMHVLPDIVNIPFTRYAYTGITDGVTHLLLSHGIAFAIAGIVFVIAYFVIKPILKN
jgi:hypothetical protein